MSIFSGQILITIKHKERREFEFRLQEIDRWYKSLNRTEKKWVLINIAYFQLLIRNDIQNGKRVP